MIGPITKLTISWLQSVLPATRFGPNERAGLKPAPVSGPKHITIAPSVPPMTHGAHAFSARTFTAAPMIAHIRPKVPISSTNMPDRFLPCRNLSLTPVAP